jgi:23S rRNA (cytidine1920-2'-O)/16S rRNA (cytidine1409-2'-O)-methyltransferase
MKKTRIDIYMVSKGFSPSRTKAQDLIKAGLVAIRLPGDAPNQTKEITSANEMVDEDLLPEIVVQKNPLGKYVSRAGLKMEGALHRLKLQVNEFQVLDVGISTGGFTDCLLQNGAKFVLGVDVGHNQLSHKLKSDPRVSALEGVNAREIHKNALVLERAPVSGFDLAVVDVSFISLTLVLPSVIKLVKKSKGSCLALVKPQFEVGPGGIGKNGIVKNRELYQEVRDKILKTVGELGGINPQFFESDLEGKDGNQEFFVFFEV